MREVGFLEVRLDPHVVIGDDRHDGRAGLHILAERRHLARDAGERRAHDGVLEIERGRVARRLRGEIRGLLGDGPIEVAAQARANLVERALGDLNLLVRDVALVPLLVDVDLGRELAFGERGEPVELALLVGGVRAREGELLESLSVRGARALDEVVDRGELRVGALERDVERAVVEREQHVARFDALVLAHLDGSYRARDFRADDTDVGFDVRVVGLDDAARRVIDVRADGERDERPQQQQRRAQPTAGPARRRTQRAWTQRRARR